MDTKKKLENDLKDAIRANDTVRKRTLRMVLTAIRFVEIDKRETLDESGVLSILQKEVRSNQEVIEESQRAERPDLVAEAEAEIAILEEYLPDPLSPEELQDLAQQVIEEVGASSPREMGQVMKALMPRLEGRATGQQASQVVRKLLLSHD